MTLLNKIAGLGTATTLIFIAVGPAEAFVKQSYDSRQIAYSYVYYNDAAKTEEAGYAADHCGGSQYNFWVIKPNIPSPYYDETPMYVCTSNGPYLPSDW